MVDAVTGTRPRVLALSDLHTVAISETGRPIPAVTGAGRRRRSGYAPHPEDLFARELLDSAIETSLGYDEPAAVVYVRANEDWASGGIARLAFDHRQIGPVCRQALHRAGYGAEPAPEHVAGHGFALRFRKADHQPLCPALEVRRPVEDWDPWSCGLERGHEVPHHHLAMNYRWVDDVSPKLCGAWARRAPGLPLGSCGLSAGHPPEQRHRDTLWEALIGRRP